MGTKFLKSNIFVNIDPGYLTYELGPEENHFGFIVFWNHVI